MVKSVTLCKNLGSTGNGKYIENLEIVVNDLSSTSFNRDVTLHHEKEYNNCAICYDINYGTNTRKDSSGVPEQEDVLEYDVDIAILRELKRHIKKAKTVENPDFKIGYKELSFDDELDQTKSHGDLHRIKKIELHEEDSSTHIAAILYDDETIYIQFEYDERNNKKEINRINRAVTNLKNKNYEEKHII